MRDFVYNEDEVNAGKNELTKLASDKKKQFVSQLAYRAISPYDHSIHVVEHLKRLCIEFGVV